MQKLFFIFFYSLVRLSFDLQDKFFRTKFIRKTNSLFEKFLELKVEKGSEHVAQSRLSARDLLAIIDEINELIEILIYLKIVNLSPALLTQKKLLDFKSEILEFLSEKTKEVKLKEANEGEKLDISVPTSRQTEQSEEKHGMNTKNQRLMLQILEILKNSDEVQSGVLAQTLAVPRRTIQRYLNDLLASGKILKKKARGFTKYQIIKN